MRQHEQRVFVDILLDYRRASIESGERGGRAVDSNVRAQPIDLRFQAEVYRERKHRVGNVNRFQALLRGLGRGLGIDGALREAYGFGRDGLERRWREQIGASPLPADAGVRSRPTPLPLPDIVPYGVETPTPFPTSAPSPAPTSSPTPTATAGGPGGCGRSSGQAELGVMAGMMLGAVWVWRRATR